MRGSLDTGKKHQRKRWTCLLCPICARLSGDEDHFGCDDDTAYVHPERGEEEDVWDLKRLVHGGRARRLRRDERGGDGEE